MLFRYNVVYATLLDTLTTHEHHLSNKKFNKLIFDLLNDIQSPITFEVTISNYVSNLFKLETLFPISKRYQLFRALPTILDIIRHNNWYLYVGINEIQIKRFRKILDELLKLEQMIIKTNEHNSNYIQRINQHLNEKTFVLVPSNDIFVFIRKDK